MELAARYLLARCWVFKVNISEVAELEFMRMEMLNLRDFALISFMQIPPFSSPEKIQLSFQHKALIPPRS